MLSVDSVQFNITHSIFTTILKPSVGQNSITIPYKIDMGSDGNIMPMHIFKKLFLGVIHEQQVATINKLILLKMYNETTIIQLDMCRVVVEHNNKKKCQFL